MKKRKTGFTIGILLLLAVCAAAGVYWAWNNPFFGRRLSAIVPSPAETQAAAQPAAENSRARLS
jgi:hypothetical protein